MISPLELEKLASAMNRKYGYVLEGRRFSISAKLAEDDGVYVTMVLQNEDETFVYPVEGRMKYRFEDLSKKDAALFLIDYIDAYFEDYLDSDGDLMLPIDWKDFSYEAHNFQLRGQVLNLKLERMADAILSGQHSID